MPPTVVVRRASRDDLDAICGITREASPGRVAPDRGSVLEKLLEWAYFVSATTKVMGVVRWQATNFVACLKDLYVYPPVQRRRICAPLLARVEEEARGLSCEVALLLTDRRSSWRAIKFYRELGYERAKVDRPAKAWADVAEEHVGVDEILLLKRLRETRIMAPM